ncbi:DUF6355 family natural product biosynthesis protein [Microbacterium sp. NPDC057944]|uniref:DUF6355 family natural product biosynthesis protein n=1 Tax=Microbacterium sp. NPDC057944 TaxID=3346286 RepID=UPI0036DAE38E
MMMKTRKRLAGLLAIGLAIGGLSVAGNLVQAEPAQAYVCGYAETIKHVDSQFKVDLPWGGSIDLFGGDVRIANYGNCGKSNVRVTMTTDNGKKTVCIRPGNTVLGPIDRPPHVRNVAKLSGSC